MRCRNIVLPVLVLVLYGCAFAQNERPPSQSITQFEIGRRTFFDFGPPFDFYEVFLVRKTPSGTSVERITLSPPGDECVQPAKVETAASSLTESIENLLGNANPCKIPEKELRRELKRCKKCSVFSGANVAMQVQCGTQTRIIRADILDRDIFDPASKTPERTSWTMQLLQRLDQAAGPGVMDQPAFAIPGPEKKDAPTQDSEVLRGIGAGLYDDLFKGAPHKPSDLYRAAQVHLPIASSRLVSSAPFQPEVFANPDYPPLARVAHIEGIVDFTIDVNTDGSVANFAIENGHPLLRGAAQKAVESWKFPKDAAGQRIHAAIEFSANCHSSK